MIPSLKYLILTLKHKWFLFLAGRKLKVSLWRRITHDWSKLTPRNLSAYGRQFFGAADRPQEFIRAWLRHQNTHDHHWEYWIPRTGYNRCDPPIPGMVPVDMPESAIREMLADWVAASRAYSGVWPRFGNWKWLEENYTTNIKPNLSKKTATSIEQLVLKYLVDALEG
jgi:hypothetical protein